MHKQIIVLVEGISSNTSNTLQASYSYMPQDIEWNKRFVDMISISDNCHVIDLG